MIRLAKRTIREEIKRDWSCGKNISRIQLLRWTKHQNATKVSTEVGSRLCGSKAAMTCDRVVSDLLLPLWEEVCGFFWMLGIMCLYAQPLRSGIRNFFAFDLSSQEKCSHITRRHGSFSIIFHILPRCAFFSTTSQHYRFDSVFCLSQRNKGFSGTLTALCMKVLSSSSSTSVLFSSLT